MSHLTRSSVPAPTPLLSSPPRAVGQSGASRAGLVATCALALAIGSVGITDEAYVSAGGDMARYLMNGVYLRDLAADRPLTSWSEFVEYTRLYYARYPALSLGHHPVLLPALEALLFAAFGISISAARLIPLASLVIAAAFLYAIVNRRYGPLAAVSAAALFVTSPVVVTFARSLMAEMPSIALVVVSAYYLQRYSESGRRAWLVSSGAAFVLSLYAKPHALLLTPALFITALAANSATRLLKRDLWLAAVVVGILAAPAVAVPLMLSPSNMYGVVQVGQLKSATTFMTVLSHALEPQLAWPVLIVAAAGALRAIIQRDARALLFLLWIASVTPALFFFGGLGAEGRRYTLYWVPAWCALAGSLLAGWRPRVVPTAIAGILAVGLAMQATRTETIERHITGAGGYEEAAQFVLSANPGPTVLFSGDVDTGYFSFFVRKHDPARRLVVLRSDKLYTTSLMAQPSVADRIERPDQIYTALHQFGTRLVVLEDRPSLSRVLEMLRHELKSSRFTERRRIAIGSTDPRLVNTSLVVFELTDPSPPDVNAVLLMDVPLVGQSLAIPFRDLLDRKFLR